MLQQQKTLNAIIQNRIPTRSRSPLRSLSPLQNCVVHHQSTSSQVDGWAYEKLMKYEQKIMGLSNQLDIAINQRIALSLKLESMQTAQLPIIPDNLQIIGSKGFYSDLAHFTQNVVISALNKSSTLGQAAILVIDQLKAFDSGNWACSFKLCNVEGVLAFETQKSIIFTFHCGGNEYYVNISKLV